MGREITLAEYERTEKEMALREARRGLVIHAVGATIGLVFHVLAVTRWGKASVERRQQKIERKAMELRDA